MKITSKWPLMAALCFIGFGSLVSCDDDNDPTPPPTILNFAGDYEGTMVSTVETTEVGSSEITFKLTGDTVEIASLPVKPLIKAVLENLGQTPTEEQVDAIVAALGETPYKIGYTYTSKKDMSSAELTLNPKALTIEFILPEVTPIALADEEPIEPTPLIISVEIGAKDKGLYTAETGKLTFGIEVESVKLGATALPDFKTISIAFDTKKQ